MPSSTPYEFVMMHRKRFTGAEIEDSVRRYLHHQVAYRGYDEIVVAPEVQREAVRAFAEQVRAAACGSMARAIAEEVALRVRSVREAASKAGMSAEVALLDEALALLEGVR